MGGIGAPEKLIVKGKRLDGRAPDELRPIIARAGIIPNAAGSAYYKQGNTEVIAAVYGPHEVFPKHLSEPDRAYLSCTYGMASFSTPDRVRPGPSRRSTEISTVITDSLTPALALDKYPKTKIDVILQVINANGGTRCAAINAAAIALADAGIEMKDMVAAVAVGKVDGTLVLDLFDVEDNFGEADMPIAFLSRTKNITLLQMDGEFTRKEIEEGIETCKKAVDVIFKAQRDALKTKFSVESKGVEE